MKRRKLTPIEKALLRAAASKRKREQNDSRDWYWLVCGCNKTGSRIPLMRFKQRDLAESFAAKLPRKWGKIVLRLRRC